MIAALGDCVPVLQQVKHEPSPQVMLDLFEKEIGDTLNEVSIPKRRSLVTLFITAYLASKYVLSSTT